MPRALTVSSTARPGRRLDRRGQPGHEDLAVAQRELVLVARQHQHVDQVSGRVGGGRRVEVDAHGAQLRVLQRDDLAEPPQRRLLGIGATPPAGWAPRVTSQSRGAVPLLTSVWTSANALSRPGVPPAVVAPRPRDGRLHRAVDRPELGDQQREVVATRRVELEAAVIDAPVRRGGRRHHDVAATIDEQSPRRRPTPSASASISQRR